MPPRLTSANAQELYEKYFGRRLNYVVFWKFHIECFFALSHIISQWNAQIDFSSHINRWQYMLDAMIKENVKVVNRSRTILGSESFYITVNSTKRRNRIFFDKKMLKFSHLCFDWLIYACLRNLTPSLFPFLLKRKSNWNWGKWQWKKKRCRHDCSAFFTFYLFLLVFHFTAFYLSRNSFPLSFFSFALFFHSIRGIQSQAQYLHGMFVICISTNNESILLQANLEIKFEQNEMQKEENKTNIMHAKFSFLRRWINM